MRKFPCFSLLNPLTDMLSSGFFEARYEVRIDGSNLSGLRLYCIRNTRTVATRTEVGYWKEKRRKLRRKDG